MSIIKTGMAVLLLALASGAVQAGGFYSPTYGVRGRVYSNYMNNYAGERMASRGLAVRRGNRYYLVRPSPAVPYSRISRSFR